MEKLQEISEQNPHDCFELLFTCEKTGNNFIYVFDSAPGNLLEKSYTVPEFREIPKIQRFQKYALLMDAVKILGENKLSMSNLNLMKLPSFKHPNEQIKLPFYSDFTQLPYTLNV